MEPDFTGARGAYLKVSPPTALRTAPMSASCEALSGLERWLASGGSWPAEFSQLASSLITTFCEDCSGSLCQQHVDQVQCADSAAACFAADLPPRGGCVHIDRLPHVPGAASRRTLLAWELSLDYWVFARIASGLLLIRSAWQLQESSLLHALLGAAGVLAALLSVNGSALWQGSATAPADAAALACAGLLGALSGRRLFASPECPGDVAFSIGPDGRRIDEVPVSPLQRALGLSLFGAGALLLLRATHCGACSAAVLLAVLVWCRLGGAPLGDSAAAEDLRPLISQKAYEEQARRCTAGAIAELQAFIRTQPEVLSRVRGDSAVRLRRFSDGGAHCSQWSELDGDNGRSCCLM